MQRVKALGERQEEIDKEGRSRRHAPNEVPNRETEAQRHQRDRGGQQQAEQHQQKRKDEEKSKTPGVAEIPRQAAVRDDTAAGEKAIEHALDCRFGSKMLHQRVMIENMNLACRLPQIGGGIVRRSW